MKNGIVGGNAIFPAIDMFPLILKYHDESRRTTYLFACERMASMRKKILLQMQMNKSTLDKIICITEK